jgi:hypothetical protein
MKIRYHCVVLDNNGMRKKENKGKSPLLHDGRTVEGEVVSQPFLVK